MFNSQGHIAMGSLEELPTFPHEVPGPRFEPATKEVEGEHSNHYTSEPPFLQLKQYLCYECFSFV